MSSSMSLGYYAPGTAGSTFVPLTPARVLDSRIGTGLSGSFVSGSPRTLTVAGAGGVPADATAVTGNLVAVVPASSGYLSIGPAVSATPTTSSLNVLTADTRAAAVTVKLDGERPGRRSSGRARQERGATSFST